MGTLYRKCCENCDSIQNVTFDGFVGAVVSDGGKPGDIMSEGYLAYLRADNDLVTLPHPVEESTLKDAGGSWNSATLSGRILRFTNLICTDCGAINTTASVDSGTLGCITGLVFFASMIAASKWHFNFHWLITVCLGWLAMCGPMLAWSFYLRRRYGKNAVPYKFVRCIKCGGGSAVALRSCQNQNLPCEKCGQNSVTLTIAGRS